VADKTVLEQDLPVEALLYLDVLGMPLTAAGKRMTYVAAAKSAGVSYSNVWSWRQKYAGFAEMEQRARTGRRESTGRKLARQYVNALVGPAGRSVLRELEAEDGDARLAWDVLKTAAGIADVHEVRGSVTYTAEQLAEDRERAAQELEEWEREQGMGDMAGAGESPPGVPAAGGV